MLNKKGKIIRIDFDFEYEIQKVPSFKMDELEINLENKKQVKQLSFKGGIYHGEIKMNQFNGFGSYQLEAGDFYLGLFKNGLKHGYGIYKI